MYGCYTCTNINTRVQMFHIRHISSYSDWPHRLVQDEAKNSHLILVVIVSLIIALYNGKNEATAMDSRMKNVDDF